MPTRKKERAPEAERIFQLRKQLGLDQIPFAERLGVDQGTVSKWENGRAKPGRHTYIQLAELASGDLKRLLLNDGGFGYRAEGEKLFAQDGYVDAARVYHDLSKPDQTLEAGFDRSLSFNQSNRPESGSGATLDLELLRFVIETIDSELRKRKLRLPSDKFAEAVVLSYEYLHGNEQRDSGRDSEMVGRLLKFRTG